jgi:hypothetical protein
MSVGTGEVLQGVWRFEVTHPEWTEEEGGEDGWERIVAWWALRTSRGLLLIDPLVLDWDLLDGMVAEHGGCAGIVRTIHWHQRSVAQAAKRYDAGFWSGPAPNGAELAPIDHLLLDGQELWDGIQAFSMERADEVALWLPAHAALLFGDAMLRREDGQLRVCPDSWTQPPAGSARLRELLSNLARLPSRHVLVAHGPLVLGDGRQSVIAAIS